MICLNTQVRPKISNIWYVVDASGKKIAMIIPLEEYSELLEDLHDLSIIAERRDEPTVPFQELKNAPFIVAMKNPKNTGEHLKGAYLPLNRTH